jgi:hypothetical protein
LSVEVPSTHGRGRFPYSKSKTCQLQSGKKKKKTAKRKDGVSADDIPVLFSDDVGIAAFLRQDVLLAPLVDEEDEMLAEHFLLQEGD